MKGSAHIGFWIIASFAALFIVPLFISANDLRDRLVLEHEAVQEVFGDSISARILGTATEVYEVFARSSVKKAVASGIHTEEQRRDAERYLTVIGHLAADLGSAYLQSVLMHLYAVVMRLCIVLTWMLMLLPFLAAVLIDGFSSRAVKRQSFGYQNPAAFALGMHAVILIAVLPLAYIVLPIHITPMLMPLWALVSAVPLCFAISHMQPVLTR